MENEGYSVFVKTDERGRIVDINSNAFLSVITGWIEIGRGDGDKYHHAQGNYLPEPLMDENGVCRYKLERGEIIKRTNAEMAGDSQPQLDAPQVGTNIDDRITAVEQQIEMLLEGVTEDG